MVEKVWLEIRICRCFSLIFLGVQRSMSSRISLRREREDKEKRKKLQRMATMPGKCTKIHLDQYKCRSYSN